MSYVRFALWCFRYAGYSNWVLPTHHDWTLLKNISVLFYLFFAVALLLECENDYDKIGIEHIPISWQWLLANVNPSK